MKKWDTVWKKKSQRQVLWLIVGIAYMIIAIFMMSNLNHTGYIFLSLAMFLIVSAANFLFYMRKRKKEYVNKIEEVSEKYQKQTSPIIWNFEEDFFEYCDFQYSFRLNWIAFSGYHVKENVLYLKLQDQLEASHSISKEETGDEKFKEIIDFIKTKLKLINE